MSENSDSHIKGSIKGRPVRSIMRVWHQDPYTKERVPAKMDMNTRFNVFMKHYYTRRLDGDIERSHNISETDKLQTPRNRKVVYRRERKLPCK